MKALKNEVEMEGMREAHRRDGAALANFFVWLEKEVKQEKKVVSECTIDKVRGRGGGNGGRGGGGGGMKYLICFPSSLY